MKTLNFVKLIIAISLSTLTGFAIAGDNNYRSSTTVLVSEVFSKALDGRTLENLSMSDFDTRYEFQIFFPPHELQSAQLRMQELQKTFPDATVKLTGQWEREKMWVRINEFDREV